MSYCRFSEGDVYVFLNTDYLLECCGCILQETEWVKDETMPFFKGHFKPIGEIVQNRFNTTQAMLDHLQLHKDAGHDVPQFCIEGLKRDQLENDELMQT